MFFNVLKQVSSKRLFCNYDIFVVGLETATSFKKRNSLQIDSVI